MTIKAFTYVILIMALGVFIYNLLELDLSNPDKSSIIGIVGNVLVIISLVLSILNLKNKEKRG
ncbi:hypothetical protein C8P64_0631 [Christiangramia gaetbulicola]|uniref:Uncharacterized protein n=1 Tax=Christiangramia gaetbulicola TaxID=703340 RepID=A0A2T6ALG2_9FLAO|nr:hypothetical protein [Christiangramia gaetbulicola]PTX44649.1 hypothetical protein C8P64_0631 [Christiangramia gaetbulicola]